MSNKSKLKTVAARAMEEYLNKFQGLDSEELEKFLSMTAMMAIGGLRGVMGDDYADDFLQAAIDRPMKLKKETIKPN